MDNKKSVILKNVTFIAVFLLIILISLISINSSMATSSVHSSKNSKYINPAHVDTNSDNFKVQGAVSKKMNDEGSVDVIIMFDDGIDSSKILGENVDTVRKKTSSKSNSANINSANIISNVKGFNKRHTLGIINGYSGKLTRQGLDELKQQAKDTGANIKVFENKPMQILSTLNESTVIVNANYSWNVMNITGREIIVAMIDTGIDYTHLDLGNCTTATFLAGNCSKVIGGYNFVDDNNNPMDDHVYGHGTHVAGILAANGSVRGVAPDARLYALKACNSGGSCNPDDVILAIEWAKDNSARIISLSLGIIGDPNEVGNIGKDPFSQAIDNVVSDGVVVVASAGNAGPAVSTINIPGASESAITVGAIDDHGTIPIDDDTVWSGSSRGPGLFGRLDPDISAPGVNILSTCLGGGTTCSLTGTSMSAAFVSGAAALLLEQNSALTPSEVRTILVQSTSGISGKVFERGSGELNVRNALGKVYANVSHIDSYGRAVSNDRWEFVVKPYTTEYANITLINNNDYNISFSTSMESITNLENSITLNGTQIGMPQIIDISNNSNYTFSINFTLTNFSDTYATTYGGIIFFNGSGDSGTENVTKSVRIPVVITVPFMNYGRAQRTMYNPGYPPDNLLDFDVYQYCYYNNNTKNVNVYINWSSSAQDLDLYLYNSTGDSIAVSGQGYTDYESVYTTDKDTFKWFKVNGYDFISPITFSINITDIGNHPPAFQGIYAIGGFPNDTNTVLFYRPNNLTINVSYSDADNDSVTATINDSNYTLINQFQNGSIGYAVFNRGYSADLNRDNRLLLTFTDDYEGVTTQQVTVLVYSSIIIDSYTPSSNTIYMRQNDMLNFTLNVREANNKTLNYIWYVNDSNVSTAQNYTFNTTIYNATSYAVHVLIQNNDTINQSNETVSWTVFVDGNPPAISIQYPITSAVYNRSKTDINYTVIDSSSGVDKCWYSINGTLNYGSNASLASGFSPCMNTSVYLSNGNYTVTIYSNDTVGNLGKSEATFVVNDSTPPIITSPSPAGILVYTTSVTLSVTTDENATCKYSNIASNISYDSMTGSFSDNLTQHTATYSVSVGDNNISVRCADMSNNVNNDSTIIYFKVDPMPAPPSGGNGGTGGSGGSGGGGGGSGGYDTDPDSTSETFDTLNEGITDVNVNKRDIPVSRVSVNSSMNLTNVTITIKKTDAPEKNYTQDSVYTYLLLNFSSENMGVSVDALISAEIYFSVDKNWLAKNNLTKEEIVLLEYIRVNDTWNPLLTEYMNEDENKVYFVSHSLGSGLYAIGVNRTQSPGNPVIQQVVPEINKSINKSELPSVNSGNSNAVGGSKTGNIVDSLINTLKKQKDLLYIIWALFGTFVFVITFMTLIKGKALKQYKNELIMATDKEFKDATNVLSKKVPSMPEDIRNKLSKMVDQRFSEAIRQENAMRKNDAIKRENDSKTPNAGNPNDVAKNIEDLKKSVEKTEELKRKELERDRGLNKK